MPTERLSMRRIRQVLQLHFGVHASARAIAREVGVGRTTVQDYLTRAVAAGLGWPLTPDLTDEALEQFLFPTPNCKPGARRHPEPDWAALVREMKRPGVSLSILWEEYASGSSGMATPIAGSVSCSASSSGACRRRCARPTSPVTRRSSTIPASVSRSPIRSPARCVWRRSSSPCSAPRT